MEVPFEYLKNFDVVNLIAIGVMVWFFYSRLDKKIDRLEEKIESRFEKIEIRFEKVDQRFDKLEEKVTDIDRRICRLEGAFTSKESCRIGDERNMKRAE